jgi:2-dehydropantoate 2-reductase
MRLLIVGAGVIGVIFGWALAGAGHEVTHLVRPGRAARYGAGVEIDMLDRRRRHKRRFRGRYDLEAIETLEGTAPFELIIVPVKHYRLDEALAEIVPSAGAADFVLLTQNWAGAGSFDAILPRSRYVFGDARAGGRFIGETLVGTLRSVDIGPCEGAPDALARRAAALFESAGVPAGLHPDMLHYLWVQYAATGAMWAALIDAGGVDAVFRSRARAEAVLDAGRECLCVAAQRGVDLSLYSETQPFFATSRWRRRLSILGVSLLFRYDPYTKRASAHAFGDPVEVARFYDDLVGTGRDLGVPMPVMDSYGPGVRRFAEA